MTSAPRVVVERLWPGETVVCLGTGESLTQRDVDRCRGLRVIAINDAFTLAPWADVLFAGDRKWWDWHPEAAHFAGLKVSLESFALPLAAVPDVRYLRIAGLGGRAGLSTDPTTLATGYSSGYAAINLAYHLAGPTRVLLLGYDMHGSHFFGAHPDKSHPQFVACLAAFERLVAPAKTAGLEIVNCTPQSALRCFPLRSLDASLEEVAA